jgi:Holliday junction resolvasome RuvABC endonuclease subunit
MKTVKVVGMDPSLQNWGVARATLDLDTFDFQIDSLNLISTEPEKDKKLKKVIRKNCEDLARARILYGGMMLACTDASIAFVEVPVGSQSARAMASYGVCIGVLAACRIPIIEVLPGEVKKAVTGHKNATKEEMMEWAARRFPHAPWNRHTRTSAGRAGKGGMIVGAYNAGDLTNDNEHLADAAAAIQAGISTDEFQRLVSVMKGSFGELRAA